MKETKVARKATARGRKPEPPRRKLVAARPPGQEKAIEEFGAAVKLFGRRDLARAREQFKALIEKYPQEREIADRARTYILACERALQPPAPRLREADDYYHQGVFLLNQQNYAEASRMLEKALAMAPGSEKVLYAQACVMAMSGRREEALEALERAVAANPANRVRAANDRDLDALREDPSFAALVRGAGSDLA